MSLKVFEDTLDKLDIAFHKRPASKNLDAELESPAYKPLTYPVTFREEQYWQVVVVCWLPPARVEVNNCDALLSYLDVKQKYLNIGFDQEAKRFYFSGELAPESYQEDLEWFQRKCDLLFPTLLLIGSKGSWNKQFIDMALEPPNEMYRA